VGFSNPAYDLQTLQSTLHHASILDNSAIINQTMLATLEKGLWAMTTTRSTGGGFPMYMLVDGSEKYGDTGSGFAFCAYYPGHFSLQGGTPLVGSVYLRMYELEPNPVYLEVAEQSARALIAVQNPGNGGFEYNGRQRPDGTGYPGTTMTLDDDVSQGCLRFLLEVYRLTGNVTYRTAAMKGLEGILSLEIPGGGFPQRSHYGPEDYQSYVTLNDYALEDTVNLLLQAADTLDEPRYLAAAERAGQFLIRVQGNGGSALQQGWAQQYKNDQPAWARRMEPPAMCSAQTGSAIRILMELYLATGNQTYLDPIPAAITWLTDLSTLVPNVDDPSSHYWSRLYELETNKMIVGNRNEPGGPVYYYEYDPVRDFGYSWLGTYGINTTLDQYAYLEDAGFDATAYVTWRDAPPSAASYAEGAAAAAASITHDGFWLGEKDGLTLITDSAFASAASTLIEYFAAIIREL
jgi:PelA/Pel-15E family pectate lyase